MTLKTIQDRLLEGDMFGDEIASSRSYIAVMLARGYEAYARCLSLRAEWTTTNRDQYKSQAECERAYEATDAGKEETVIKYSLKAYEAIQEVLTSLWFQINREEKL